VRRLVSNRSLEERKESVPNDVIPVMDVWTLILMLGVTAIWAALAGAVAHLVRDRAGT
jgi:hypothetical protein